MQGYRHSKEKSWHGLYSNTRPCKEQQCKSMLSPHLPNRLNDNPGGTTTQHLTVALYHDTFPFFSKICTCTWWDGDKTRIENPCQMLKGGLCPWFCLTCRQSTVAMQGPIMHQADPALHSQFPWDIQHYTHGNKSHEITEMSMWLTPQWYHATVPMGVKA